MRTRFTGLTGVLMVVAVIATPLIALGSSTPMACHKPVTGCSHHVALSTGCCGMRDQAPALAPAPVPATPDPPVLRTGDGYPSFSALPAPAVLLHIPSSPPRVALLDLSTLFSTFLL